MSFEPLLASSGWPDKADAQVHHPLHVGTVHVRNGDSENVLLNLPLPSKAYYSRQALLIMSESESLQCTLHPL